ncbi:putative alcohol dehydrogenase [Aaosphaeria arxii CBS 175.79]|uniref:Putative alcohol dehydrogenase n=1 Tax=Aaosphaeria arxii CBS 175.79 TaxID=1450172 RepID=A0A6A5XZV6_9PLEO|nr:putative alcohol dehydrogenase [Aaosphaeria arxii CBS 175.79]KAF2017834.1 putative alcohol dehydrogenase [Aaosphaeria arxii CBS 175.79]
MSTQKAIVVNAVGERAVVANKPIPQPGSKQVQVRVTATALNPHDQSVRDRGLFMDFIDPPVTLANDIAGIVTATAPDVTKLKVGDAIFWQGSLLPGYIQQGLQEYAIADEDFVSKIPEGFTINDVLTLPTNLIASVVGLFGTKTGLGIPAPWKEDGKSINYSDVTVLIIGGGSNCGRFAVQLAGLAGFGKVVVVGGSEEQLKPWGATHVIDRHGGHDVVLSRIREIVGDDLLYAYDAVNPDENQRLGINALSSTKRGKFARLVRRWERDDSILNPKQNGFELINVFGSSHVVPDICAPLWAKIGEYLLEGKIVPLQYEVVEGLDVDKVNEVLDGYRDGKRVVQTHFRLSQ